MSDEPLTAALKLSVKEHRRTQKFILLAWGGLFLLGVFHLGEMIYNNHFAAPDNRGKIHDKLDRNSCKMDKLIGIKLSPECLEFLK